MSRVYEARSLGTVEHYAEAMGKLARAGDYVLVIRGLPRSIVMSCPDGCGELIVVNLDRRSGPAWRYYNVDDRLSIYPSVWRESGCRAHFIVCRDRIYWCGIGESSAGAIERSMKAAVLAKLDRSRAIHYEEIAGELGAIPWEVCWACYALVRDHAAVEVRQGHFQLHTDTKLSSFP